MKTPYSRKILLSSLALALTLSGGALYASTNQALAAEAAGTAAADHVNGQNGPFDWFSKNRSGTESTDQRSEGNSKEPHAKGKGMPVIEEAASILGMEPEALKAALKDQTLVQIAAGKGITEDALLAKLQTARAQKIDEAVAAGRISADKAEAMKARMGEHLKFMVNHKMNGEWKEGRGGKHHRHRVLPAPEKLAAILGLTEAELNTQLQSGKSLTEIAESRGMSKEQLISRVKEEMTPWIEKMVDHRSAPGGSEESGDSKTGKKDKKDTEGLKDKKDKKDTEGKDKSAANDAAAAAE